MVKQYGDLLYRDGKQYNRTEYEGTHEERLALSTDGLKDCDEFWETDTHKLKSWNASSNKWVPEDE